MSDFGAEPEEEIAPRSVPVEMIKWKKRAEGAMRKRSLTELNWCIKEAKDIGYPSDHPDVVAVKKYLKAEMEDDDHHPSRTELTAKEPMNLTRMEEGALAFASMTGDNEELTMAMSSYLKSLSIDAENPQRRDGLTLKQSNLQKHENNHHTIEIVWKHVDLDGDGVLSSTEAKEAVRVLLSRPELRKSLGKPLLHKLNEKAKNDAGLSQSLSDIKKESSINQTRNLDQLCRRSVSKACLDLARRLPEVTDSFWETMDIDKDGQVEAKEFIMSFEEASRAHLIAPVLRIAEERMWDIIGSRAWRERDLDKMDSLALVYRKQRKHLRMKLDQSDEEIQEMENRSCVMPCSITKDDCVIC